jgi:hypothetical protein
MDAEDHSYDGMSNEDYSNLTANDEGLNYHSAILDNSNEDWVNEDMDEVYQDESM